jgi:hypothetical protein
MGEIVAGVLASHAPLITAKPVISVPEQRARFLASFDLLRQRLEQARPDLLVIFVNDHLQNFFYNNMPAYCVGLADAYQAPSKRGAEFLRIPPRRVPGAKAWARELLEAGWEAGFDFAYSQELEFWDDASVPLHFLMPQATVPIVPILTNCAAPPLPPPRRSYQLGRFVREFIQKRPKGERVALLGSGGISHWVGTPETGKINPDFDQRVLDSIRQGQGEALAALSDGEIEKEGGNGGQELRNWIAVLGALPGHTGEVLSYEAVPDWIAGVGTVWLTL